MKFQCSLDDGRFERCGEGVTGQWTGRNIPHGRHNFKVTGTDNIGNVVEAEVRGWYVDAVPPVITFDNPPTTTNGSPELTWRSSEQANFECSFDGGRFESCRSGMNGRWSKQNVPDGTHSLLVRGTDNLGNVGRSTKHSWIIGKIFYFKDLEHCI